MASKSVEKAPSGAPSEERRIHLPKSIQAITKKWVLDCVKLNTEEKRLLADANRLKNWKRWGPYMSERQWGTVREDYSPDGSCWDYFGHDQARKRAYRWGEDGLLGITDRQCRLCFAYSLWNGKDAILKERLFGLTGPEGNHGEDVKELYYYLDSTPTHSYMKSLYKYPQNEYPYEDIVRTNRERGVHEREYELEDTGVFDNNEYWDVFSEYAKASPMDILCKMTVVNRGPKEATIHVLSNLWLRNTWAWGCTHEGCTTSVKPIKAIDASDQTRLRIVEESLGTYNAEFDKNPITGEAPQILFTNNESNAESLWGVMPQEGEKLHYKDAFNEYVVNGKKEAVNEKLNGTKIAGYYVLKVPAGGQVVLRSRVYEDGSIAVGSAFSDFDQIFASRLEEANEFYGEVQSHIPDAEERNVQRQAYAGMMFSKQFYYYVVRDWLHGDNSQVSPPKERLEGRNRDWEHLFNRDIISMPDKWEYPWYASWDLAFHMVTISDIDNQFAKEQLLLFLREWFMHPNGQIPAYEFAFDDVNPPVHAWACMRVYKAARVGKRDKQFLARCFQKLILNFTWWVNRKDPQGRNIFGGGFLGLDNIGLFDRSKPLPAGQSLEQADGTAWMAFYAVIMLDIALELAVENNIYEDMASKFFEHFVKIVDAMNALGGGDGLWDPVDGFYYDHLRDEHSVTPMRIRSMVGLIPLFAVMVIEKSHFEKNAAFTKRTLWFMKNRPDLMAHTSFFDGKGDNSRLLLAVPTKSQLISVLKYLLDEEEFLSDFGIRSLSKVHAQDPYIYEQDPSLRVDYVPGESNTHMFGGNSNWRGPIWLCVNYLLIQSLNRYDYYYGDDLKVECPTRSGNFMRLSKCGEEIARRLTKIFLPEKEGGFRPCHAHGNRLSEKYAKDPAFKDLVLYYEYFHGDSGEGLGASHQLGWTGLAANCINLINGVKHGGMHESKWLAK